MLVNARVEKPVHSACAAHQLTKQAQRNQQEQVLMCREHKEALLNPLDSSIMLNCSPRSVPKTLLQSSHIIHNAQQAAFSHFATHAMFFMISGTTLMQCMLGQAACICHPFLMILSGTSSHACCACIHDTSTMPEGAQQVKNV